MKQIGGCTATWLELKDGLCFILIFEVQIIIVFLVMCPVPLGLLLRYAKQKSLRSYLEC